MPQAGRRSAENPLPEAVQFKNARIDLRIFADISRVIPPHLNLSETEQRQGLPRLTEFPVMHLMQTRDLQLELDEIKKAVQHDVWVLFHEWHGILAAISILPWITTIMSRNAWFHNESTTIAPSKM